MANAVEALIRKIATKGVLKVAEYNRDRMPVPETSHTFVTGLHAPMTEEVSLENLVITGEIPAALNGRYLRIGPNPLGHISANHHWFIGDGMVHGVRLHDGKALWYKNRWLRSNAVSAQLNETPAPGPRNPLADTVNTNVVGHAGKIWGLVEAGALPVEIGPDLETISHNPFEGTLQNGFTAHPHLDPETGEMHAITYLGVDQSTIHHVVVDKNGKVRREEPIKVKHGPMIHDSMITKNYVIIMDLPVTFSMKLLLAGNALPYQWNADHKSRVGLLPREGKNEDVIWCDVDPCAVFHPANAYETADGDIIMDVCAHDSMFASSRIGPDSTQTPFERWTIDPIARRVVRTVIDAEAQEFPRPDERFIGKEYRYAFTVALPHDGGFTKADTRIFKHDMKLSTRELHDFGTNRHPGEFVFVPRSDDAAEGDGWLMGLVIDMNNQTTDYVILDAMDFTSPPIATVHIPHRIPPGFHGNWVPE